MVTIYIHIYGKGSCHDMLIDILVKNQIIPKSRFLRVRPRAELNDSAFFLMSAKLTFMLGQTALQGIPMSFYTLLDTIAIPSSPPSPLVIPTLFWTTTTKTSSSSSSLVFFKKTCTRLSHAQTWEQTNGKSMSGRFLESNHMTFLVFFFFVITVHLTAVNRNIC